MQLHTLHGCPVAPAAARSRMGSCAAPAALHACAARQRLRRSQQPTARLHGLAGSGSRQHAPPRRLVRAGAAVAGDAAAGVGAGGGGGDEDDDDVSLYDEAATCAPAFVMVDQSNPHYSAFSIDVQDYPGLLRVVSWVFNGLGCRVHNAVMKSDDDGRAADVFWVTDLRGRKLSEGAASDVCQRLEDFLSYCAPPSLDSEFKEFICGDIAITNLVHPTLTRVTISADLFSPGLLLELASIIHGQGLSVVEGIIRGGSESPIQPDQVSDPSSIPDPPPGRRVMRFWLRKGSSGGKLGYDDVSALVYTLRAVLGDGNLTTRPPNTELTALSCAATGDCSSAAGSGSDEPGPGASQDGAGAAPQQQGSSGGGSRSKKGRGGVML